MASPRVVGMTTPPPRSGRSTLRSWVVGALLALLAFGIAVLAVGAADVRAVAAAGDAGRAILWPTLSGAVALAVPVAVALRRRHPGAVALGLGIAQLVFPVGPVMGLVLPGRMRDAVDDTDRRRSWWLAGLHVLGVVVFVLRDLRGPTPDSSFLRLLLMPPERDLGEPFDPGLGTVIVFGLILALVPVGLGLLLRARSTLARTRDEVAAVQERATSMSQEVSRQAEREIIAREVHDVIGHRLSILSLHAGALEMALAGQDEELESSARLVREGAQASMDDLRSLIAVLRDPDGFAVTDGAEPVLPSTLVDLDRVVDEAAGAGQPLTSSIFISRPEDADRVLSHAVYRVVQEILTNARKHAPGLPVRLGVRGGPEEGLVIESSNPLPDGALVPEEGRPVRSLGERVGVLGGTIGTAVEDGRWRITVHLPWRSA